MRSSLEYFFENGTHVKFYKYEIDTSGVIRNKKTDVELRLSKNKAGYKFVSVSDNHGERRHISVARAIASTFHGMPPTPKHTADHNDQNRDNDVLDNIRWATKREQSGNRTMPETSKSAFVIVKNGIEKNSKDWVEYLKDDKNSHGREYTKDMITHYAQKKQHGFSYKEYPNLPGEEWKEIIGSNTLKGRWEISNMNRVKYITKYATNVLSVDNIGFVAGYPSFVLGYCHIISFKTFFPEEYAIKKPEEIVKHIGDNKLDFRPHMLQIGSRSENAIEAHDNGCYNDNKTARMKCSSYIKGVLEKEHLSECEAERYLKSCGFEKADRGNICKALSGNRKSAYGRTWKLSS